MDICGLQCWSLNEHSILTFTLNLFYFIFYKYGCLSCSNVCASHVCLVPGMPEDGVGSLKLDRWTVVSHYVGLGISLGFSGRTASAITPCSSSPVQILTFKNHSLHTLPNIFETQHGHLPRRLLWKNLCLNLIIHLGIFHPKVFFSYILCDAQIISSKFSFLYFVLIPFIKPQWDHRNHQRSSR